MIAAPGVALLVLVAIYRVASSSTDVPTPITRGDVPTLIPLTATEDVGATRETAHTGAASASVELPRAPGTQGVYFVYSVVGPQVLLASAWMRGASGKSYGLVATQQHGKVRARGTTFVTTGAWQRVTLAITLKRGDAQVNVALLRTRRSGKERIEVDDVRVGPWQADPAAFRHSVELTGTEKLVRRNGRITVSLPREKGTQGTYFTVADVPRRAALQVTARVRGEAGRLYGLVVTQQNGAVRSLVSTWRASGELDRPTVVARLRPEDRSVNVVVQRLARRGVEQFEVHAAEVRIWAADSPDTPEVVPLTGSERLRRVRGGAIGRSAIVVDLVRTSLAGVYFTATPPRPPISLFCSVWIRGVRGQLYDVVATQDTGIIRRRAPQFRATGEWQWQTLLVTLAPADRSVHLIVRRVGRIRRDRRPDQMTVDAFHIEQAP